MILSDVDIEAKMGRLHNPLVITPWDEVLLQPASVDLTLSDSFAVQDPYHGNRWSKTVQDMVTVQPQEMILGSTLQRVEIPNDLVGRLEGKSTWGRRGIAVHLTAGFIDPGFMGQITLEIYNFSCTPVELYAGVTICQLSLYLMLTPPSQPYGHPKWNSHYQYQHGATIPTKGI